jgi:homocysteine S-methyltransferase
LAGGPLPAVSEATGMALAMEKYQLPYTLNFVINKEGRMLDGTSLDKAVQEIDAACTTPPAGYMIGCSYPSFFKAEDLPNKLLSRIIGFQANASSLDHSNLDNAEETHADDVSDWGNKMIELKKQYNIRILGGCCGTRLGHLQYIVDHI